MNFVGKASKLIKNPYTLASYLGNKGYLNWMPDSIYLKMVYRAKMNKKLRLDNPVTFNEKLQWLKINDRNPIYTRLVDKYEVREYISNIIGEEYLIPLLGIYDNFEEINFDNLPSSFVMKCTHDSGGVVICRDKMDFDMDKARKKINKSLNKNYYYAWREWPYKNIKPRIICEQMLNGTDDKLPVDYKFHCFNGKVDDVMLCVDRDTGNPLFYFFDREWNLLRYNIEGVSANQDFTLPKPKMMDKMFEIAEQLSKDLPFVRVDLYCENDKIYFGELTFFPDSGFDFTLLEETDLSFGNKIKI